MMSSIANHALAPFVILLSLLMFHLGTALVIGISDMFDPSRNVSDGETLVSAGGSFTLGFFSPSTTTRRYLGIWFSASESAVCWVANRERPLNDTSGVLVLGDTGSLLLLDSTGQVLWSSNSSGATSAVARLLESGNLVVVHHDRTNTAVLWQSFDHPSNTLLPGMKTGKNLWTGAEWYLTSWRSANDPAPGPYRRGTKTSGLPENVVWNGDAKKYRTGPWNGLWFNGVPEMPSYADMFEYQLTVSPGEVTYGYHAKAGAPLSRVVVTESGALQRLVWDASTAEWKTFYSAPRDVCDAYARCGPFGLCDVNAASTSFCGCAMGFSPASPSAWRMREASGGCRRDVPLDCGNGTTSTTDGFVVVRSVKLPDTHNASVDMSITVEECRTRCLANCSCVAYAAADIRGGDGGAGSGCIIWTDDVVDTRYTDKGQYLYLRLAKSELDHYTRRISAGIIAAVCVVCAIAAIFLVLGFIIWRKTRGKIGRASNTRADQNGGAPCLEAGKPLNATAAVSIDLATLEKATKNFSKRNVIGEGAFGVVYEGQLSDDHPLGEGLPGRKVAVKRLKISSLPNKIVSDFVREVEVMSKLRHDNLVRLLAHCNEGNERLLVYEYMQNKSLNLYIFGKPNIRASLNWPKRLEIIHGIARGVCYLHEGTGEIVIHQDLKPSNVLLDHQWRPKIADFGTAKMFLADQTGTQTVAVSLGYASPEYVNGDMTLKCDVFSFGVVLLEVVSGRRNSAEPSLLSHAWKLWEEHRITDLLDPAVPRPLCDPDLESELRRCIQIGLLCVQQSPDDRPAMSATLAMLTGKSSELDQPRRPAVQCGAMSPRADDAIAGGLSATVANLT